MLTAWRLLKTRHLAHAFDGEGARLFGGRWNSPGTRVVHVSESLALATLEVLVHLQATSVLFSYSTIRISFDEALVTEIDRSALPGNWRDFPSPPALQAIGDAWVASAVSAVLKVPSAVIDTESNYLINPAHKDFHLIRTNPPRPFVFDPRLSKH